MHEASVYISPVMDQLVISGEEEVQICELALEGRCHTKMCGRCHYILPYLWQICVDGANWMSIHQYNEDIEKAFCNPNIEYFTLRVSC